MPASWHLYEVEFNRVVAGRCRSELEQVDERQLLVGLRDVTVLGVDERLRQPLEVCVDPQHPGSIALSGSQKVQVPLFDRRHIKVGHAPEVPFRGQQLPPSPLPHVG
jgi:hypothetical protein